MLSAEALNALQKDYLQEVSMLRDQSRVRMILIGAVNVQVAAWGTTLLYCQSCFTRSNLRRGHGLLRLADTGARI